jgi:hypothetical protein
MLKHCVSLMSWVIASAAILVAAVPAQAFYWYGWPGSGTPPPHTVVDPPPGGAGPPTRPPVGPPDNQNNPPPGGGGEPHSTPEPTTGLAALFGIGALAAARRWRKKPGSKRQEWHRASGPAY